MISNLTLFISYIQVGILPRFKKKKQKILPNEAGKERKRNRIPNHEPEMKQESS
jgi:hypothetical protein